MPALRRENRAGIPPGSRFGGFRFIPRFRAWNGAVFTLLFHRTSSDSSDSHRAVHETVRSLISLFPIPQPLRGKKPIGGPCRGWISQRVSIGCESGIFLA